MIDYVGDISKADAEVLANFASCSTKILEFGCGASTQVLASYSIGKLISLDTERLWLEKTAQHLIRLGIEVGKVQLLPFTFILDEKNLAGSTFDLIFDDGVDHLRRSFALSIWPYLEPDGWLLFHDQRRKHDWDNAAALIDRYWQEIGTVYYNHEDSNITCIQKRVKPAIYSNWQIDENIDMSKW